MIINDLFYGVIFFFIVVPIIFCFIFLVPKLVDQDIEEGLLLIKESNILQGVAALTRPIWGSILYLLLVMCFIVICLWEEL